MAQYKVTAEIKGAYLAAVKTQEVTNSEKGNRTFVNFSLSANGEVINAWADASDFPTLPTTDRKYDVVLVVSSKIGAYNKEVSYLSVRVVSLTESN